MSKEINKKNPVEDAKKITSPKIILENDSEVRAAEEVINSLNYYFKYVLLKLKRHGDAIRCMNATDRLLIDQVYFDQVLKVRKCAEINQKVFKLMVEWGVNMLDDEHFICKGAEITQLRPSSEHFMSKARSTLKQIVRDWTIQGKLERSTCYDIILKDICGIFPDINTRYQCEILVPGAGLGRFAWELRKCGFSVTGNEFSIYMLLASNFLLNACKKLNEYTIYPYILDFSNSWSYEDQLKPITFPDINPALKMLNPNTFSMCAGDFREAFSDELEKFHCVATVFFLDTASNPIEYIRLIHQILVPGGVWLNFGPLTYHFEDSTDQLSLELPFDEILQIVEKVGFKIDKILSKSQLPDAKYTCNLDSMLHYNYKCGYFICTKIPTLLKSLQEDSGKIQKENSQ